MNELFTFLIDILESAFYCWRVIYPDEIGVRTFCGRNPVALDTGLHFMCPVVGDLAIVEVKEQVLDLRSQSLTTKDNKAIAIGLSVAYEVLDPIRAIYEVQDWDQSLEAEMLGVAGEYVLTRTFGELLSDSGLSKNVLDEIRKVATSKWGLKVLRIRRSDFASCRSIRLMHEPNQTVVEGE